jgi:hypothetical protein
MSSGTFILFSELPFPIYRLPHLYSEQYMAEIRNPSAKIKMDNYGNEITV